MSQVDGPPNYISVCQSVCVSVWVCVYVCVYAYVCECVCVYVCASVCPSRFIGLYLSTKGQILMKLRYAGS